MTEGRAGAGSAFETRHQVRVVLKEMLVLLLEVLVFLIEGLVQSIELPVRLERLVMLRLALLRLGRQRGHLPPEPLDLRIQAGGGGSPTVDPPDDDD